MVVVVDAPNPEHAFDWVGDELAGGIHWDKPLDARFVGEPLEVAELEEYDTRSLTTAIATAFRDSASG
jgi:hypothetical protein